MTIEVDKYIVEVDRGEAPEQYTAPPNAKYYPIKSDGDLVISILPEKYILMDDQSRYTLLHLRRHLKEDHYNKKIKKSDIDKLDINIMKLYFFFEHKKAIRPIYVRQKVPIANPSQNDPSKPTVHALGAPAISKYPILTDYYYQVIDGSVIHALSMFFGYKYIPVSIKI